MVDDDKLLVSSVKLFERDWGRERGRDTGIKKTPTQSHLQEIFNNAIIVWAYTNVGSTTILFL